MSRVYRGSPMWIHREEDARALLAGGPAAAETLIRLLTGFDDGAVGVWWTSAREVADSHAWSTSLDPDLTIKGALAEAETGRGWYGADLPLLLTAATPEVWEQEDWQVPYGSPVTLISALYWVGLDDADRVEVSLGRRTLTASSGIRYEVETDSPDSGAVAAYDGETFVGSLSWGPGADVVDRYVPETDGFVTERPPRIENVHVHRDYRRRGIAREMLRRAREVTPGLLHENRPHKLSPDGEAWRRAVGSLPSGIRFEVTVMPDYLRAKQPVGGTVYAFLDGGNPEELAYPYLKDCVGILRWYSSGEIDSVWVHPDLRRQGLATDLLRRAREADPTVHHSDVLTPAGAAWRERVGSTDLGLESEQEAFERTRDMFFLRNGTDGQDLGSQAGATYEFLGWATTPWGTTGGRVVAYQGMSTVGSIEWVDGVITSVWVARGYRRQGVATRLLEHARALTPGGVQHSTLLTDDGAAWSQKVGSTAGLTFTHHPGTLISENESLAPAWTPSLHTLAATSGGRLVGAITWFEKPGDWSNGSVDGLWVHPSHRRQGIATELLRRAREINPEVDPTATPWFTDDGKAFVNSLPGVHISARHTATSRTGSLTWRKVRWGYMSGDLFLERAPGNQWNLYENASLNEDGTVNYVYPDDCVNDGYRSLTEAKADAERLRREGALRTGSLRYVHEPSRSEYGGIVRTIPRMVAYDGDREVGSLTWDVLDPKVFGTVTVHPDYRGRGIATRLYEEAKKVNPDLDPETSVFFTPAGRAWVDSLTRTAGPASDMVPFSRFPLLRPDHFGPRDVKVLRMAEKDIARLHPGQQTLVRAVIEDLRNGRAHIEPKERPPLVGSYTVRVTNSLRLGLYLTEDQPGGDPAPDWVVYWVGDHNYSEAERRMQFNPTASRTTRHDQITT